MIDPAAKLSVSRQAIVLGISRGSVYYKPRPVSDADLKLMHRIDKLHMEFTLEADFCMKARRTASRRNSGVGLFPFPIEHLLVPQLVLSTFTGQVHSISR